MTIPESQRKDPDPASVVAQALEQVCRERLRLIGDVLEREFGMAGHEIEQDAIQDAICKAIEVWPVRGLPVDPAGWLFRVARNRVLDVLRHERHVHTETPERRDAIWSALYPNALAGSAAVDGALVDPELRSIYLCCAPQLAPLGQVALTLKIVCEFSVPEIARALVRSEAAVQQQLARSKRRLRQGGRFVNPPNDAGLVERLPSMLNVVYLMFNEGYHTVGADTLLREDLCGEAIRICDLLLEEPSAATAEVHALAALLCLLAARFPARVDARGEVVLLGAQDRSLWDRRLLARGFAHLDQAASGERLTSYHLQAEIAAVHSAAATYASTDWASILLAYDRLMQVEPSPIVALNRIIAVAEVRTPEDALRELDALESPSLRKYFFYHVVAGTLRARVGHADAAESYRRALALGVAGPSRRLIERRLGSLPGA